MADTDLTPAEPSALSLEEMQRWTGALGRVQQRMLESGMEWAEWLPSTVLDPTPAIRATAGFWADTMQLWQRFIDPAHAEPFTETPEQARDKRFKAPQWRDDPVFDFLRQSYYIVADHMLKGVDTLEGLDPKQREQVRFLTRGIVDAISPSNFPVTNPQVLEQTVESRGENLVKGLRHMLTDLGKGQLTQTDPDAFELGRNLATTPGKVVKRTPLYELIQYSPSTEQVYRTPLIIFPPWINRYYILDLTPEKSFIKWAVDQGLTVFVVSWRSADASMKDVDWQDYVEAGQIDAIDTVRALLNVDSAHVIGYCVAGTTLAATLAVLAAREQADKVKSATFFTAQVDFTYSGDLKLMVDDESLRVIQALEADGFLDGRYMAATFNLLRGRDLIWSYVTNNYLLGQDYAPFDLLHWNADVTNLPSRWHLNYLRDLYRDNLLVVPGALKIGETPVDLGRIQTPCYIQAGREDHISPAQSVWKLTEYLKAPMRFVLAGSGHIAGVVNPPAAHKYQYWTCSKTASTLAQFLDRATETKGSWWPDWIEWISSQDKEMVPAKGARIPGRGKLKALCDAPGEYVRAR